LAGLIPAPPAVLPHPLAPAPSEMERGRLAPPLALSPLPSRDERSERGRGGQVCRAPPRIIVAPPAMAGGRLTRQVIPEWARWCGAGYQRTRKGCLLRIAGGGRSSRCGILAWLTWCAAPH